MKILCDNHGKQLGILVSPDLFNTTDEIFISPGVKVITFRDSGNELFTILVSDEFINKNNIAGNGEINLNHDFPEWYAELKGACEKCIERLLEKSNLTELSKKLR
jgi:hypothetical protein